MAGLRGRGTMFRRLFAIVALCLAVPLSALAQASDRGWVADDRSHCRLWLGPVDTDDVVSVAWSGDCVDGLANGQGELITRHKAKDERIVGAVLGEQRKPLWLQRTVGSEYQKIIPGEADRQIFK